MAGVCSQKRALDAKPGVCNFKVAEIVHTKSRHPFSSYPVIISLHYRYFEMSALDLYAEIQLPDKVGSSVPEAVAMYSYCSNCECGYELNVGM